MGIAAQQVSVIKTNGTSEPGSWQKIPGTFSWPVVCQPARSINSTPWALRAMRLLIWSRCSCMAWGRTVVQKSATVVAW